MASMRVGRARDPTSLKPRMLANVLIHAAAAVAAAVAKAPYKTTCFRETTRNCHELVASICEDTRRRKFVV